MIFCHYCIFQCNIDPIVKLNFIVSILILFYILQFAQLRFRLSFLLCSHFILSIYVIAYILFSYSMLLLFIPTASMSLNILISAYFLVNHLFFLVQFISDGLIYPYLFCAISSHYLLPLFHLPFMSFSIIFPSTG